MQKMSELFFLALPHLVEFLWKLPLKQRFVVAEEGIRSNDSFLCISNDSTADY